MKLFIKEIYKNSKFYNTETIKLVFDLIIDSDDDYWHERYGVAGNKHTPAYILEKLSDDINGDVVWKIVRNPKCPIHVLLKLNVKDTEWYIRREIYYNPTYKKYVKYKIFTRIKNLIEEILHQI